MKDQRQVKLSDDTVKVSLLGCREKSTLQKSIVYVAYKVPFLVALVPFLDAETRSLTKTTEVGAYRAHWLRVNYHHGGKVMASEAMEHVEQVLFAETWVLLPPYSFVVLLTAESVNTYSKECSESGSQLSYH